MNKYKILDCTLRDGGYYNNWDFSLEIVNEYLNSISRSKIEFVELGMRNFPKQGFLGAFAYTTEGFLNSLELPAGPVYGVMIDAKTLLDVDLPIEEAINKLFVPAKESKLGLVRVAAHFTDVGRSEPIVKHLKKLGYLVGYNLMQIVGKSSKDIIAKTRLIKKWGAVDVLYFADSLGNMRTRNVQEIVKALRVEWNGVLGIHTHNNMDKGLDNTLTAMKEGVTWLDCTITGMGRGAGNTQTERLLTVLDEKSSKYNSKPIYELVIRYFEAMQKEYGWGSNLLYFLGAKYEVHPTYIQNLLSNTHYGIDEIVGAIDYLSKLDGATSYDDTIFDTALSFFNNSSLNVEGTDSIVNIFRDKSVLVIANSPNTEKYARAIKQYISKANPIVVSINVSNYISNDYIDYYVVSHNSKFLSDAPKYSQLNKPVILPKYRFTEKEICELANTSILDYGLEIVKNKLSAEGSYARIPYDNTSAYVIALLIEGQAEKIHVVGFDGYDRNDNRQQEMIETLNLYNGIKNRVELISLTPTSYPILKGSIYAPII